MTIEAALTRLCRRFGANFTTGQSEIDLHSRDESHFPPCPPDGVVYPESTDDVVDLMRICAEEACPVIPWGVGTSLEGHALAMTGGITLDMTCMNRVIRVNPDDLNVVVQPGITRKDLATELRSTGLFFPIDPGANATIGGMAACRASGTTAVRYGTLRDNVLALEVVLANGTVIRTGSAARKSAAGYDLTALFVGSEGTLGIMTEVTLKLHGRPESIQAAMCGFDTVTNCIDAVITIIQLEIPIARIEMVDAAMIRGLNRWDPDFNLPETPHLFMEFHGSPAATDDQVKRVGDIIREAGGGTFRWASRTEDRTALWRARHSAYYASKALRPGCRVLTTDVCVPISRLAEAIDCTLRELESSPLAGPIVGHVGDGNFHITLLVDDADPAEIVEAKQISARINRQALKLGGTITGEHGIGVGKLDFMQEEHGPAWDVMAALKCTLDPANILNPGKVIRLRDDGCTDTVQPSMDPGLTGLP